MVTASEENVVYVSKGCVGGWGPVNISVEDIGLYTASISIWINNDPNTLQQLSIDEGQEIIYNGYRINFLRVDVIEEPGLGSKEYAVFSFAYETETNQ